MSNEFFQAGGTLPLAAPTYICRAADEELYQQVLRGQFCYVLTSRQMGKSSLMVRTAHRLQQQGVRTAIIDLSGLGTKEIAAEQWYLGIIRRLATQLALDVRPEEWWREQQAFGAVQRFTDFLDEVVLAQTTARLVIFIDEIDSTLSLPFTDDFFAAIRSLYNMRASNSDYERLTFVLLGVAAPIDLIKDYRRTPFNIGTPIDLQELPLADAQPLQQELVRLYPTQGERLLQRIFAWSSGHPYLTQKLCLAIARADTSTCDEAQVDALVEHLFLTKDARNERNLQAVHDYVQASPDCRDMLLLYRKVYQQQPVPADERSLLQNRLKLAGLVRSDAQQQLQVRNAIYRHVFDLTWVKQVMPRNLPLALLAAVLLLLLSVGAVIAALRYQHVSISTALSERFLQTENADVRMVTLAELCEHDQQAARTLFDTQPAAAQLALFQNVNATDVGTDLRTVTTHCLCKPDSDTPRWQQDIPHRDHLLREMGCALQRANANEGNRFRDMVATEFGVQYTCEEE